jgi:cell division protein FtsL
MEYTFRQHIDNTHVVRVADPRRRREQQAGLMAMAVLFVLCFSYAWLRFETVRTGYRLEAARRQAAQLQRWNQGLELQEAALRSPGRIYAVAQTRLGMQSAAPGQILALAAPANPAAPVMASLTTGANAANR